MGFVLFRRIGIVMGQQISKMVKLAVRKGGFCFENKETVSDQRPGRVGIALRKKRMVSIAEAALNL